MIEDEKDHSGNIEAAGAREGDIHFIQRDREPMEKLRSQLKRVKKAVAELHCPKCQGVLETYTFRGFTLDRCHTCGGIWMDKGELQLTGAWPAGSLDC